MNGIYHFLFPSGKGYVGQTTQEFGVRLDQHQRANKDTLISRAFKKYGDDFVTTFLYENIDDPDELDRLEIECIEKYNTLHPNGYNSSTGGSSGRKHHDVAKQKMSESHKGIPLSDYHRQRHWESHQQNAKELLAASYDRTKYASYKKHINKYSEDTREKMSQGVKKLGYDLPTYVHEYKGGLYFVQIPYFTRKQFFDKTITEEERKSNALAHYEKYIEFRNLLKISKDVFL